MENGYERNSHVEDFNASAASMVDWSANTKTNGKPSSFQIDRGSEQAQLHKTNSTSLQH